MVTTARLAELTDQRLAGAVRAADLATIAIRVIAAFVVRAGTIDAVRAVATLEDAHTVVADLAVAADIAALAAILVVRRVEIDAVDADAIDVAARFAGRAAAFGDDTLATDAAGNRAGIWLLAVRDADTTLAGFASRAGDSARAAVHVATAEIDTVDTHAIDITAGCSGRAVTYSAADIVDA